MSCLMHFGKNAS